MYFDYPKNHWTKHGLVGIHFGAFFTIIPNMGTIFDDSEIFEIFQIKNGTVSTSHREG